MMNKSKKKLFKLKTKNQIKFKKKKLNINK